MGCAPHELHERFYAKHALTGDGKELPEFWGRVGGKSRSFFLIADVPITLLNVRYTRWQMDLP